MIRMFVLSAAMLAPHAAAAEPIVIRGATVIDTAGTKDLPNATVLIDKGRIVSVGRNVRVPRGARVIDGTGKYLIPGLIDGHVHFFQSGGIYTRPDSLDLRSDVPYDQEIAAIKARLPDTFHRYVAAGVTGAVDMGGPLWNFTVRQAAHSSKDAPHVWVAGPLLSPYQPPALVTSDPPILKTPDAATARDQAAAQLAQKPDFLKFWYIVGKDGPAGARPTLAAMVAEGRKAGVRSAVHATEFETARAAVTEGADVLVHSVDDKEVDDAFVSAVLSRGTYYIPTLIVMGRYGETFVGRNPLSPLERSAGHPDVTGPFDRLDKVKLPSWGKQAAQQLSATLPLMQRNLMKMYRAGVPIVMGTDAGNIGTVHASSVPAEMKAMAEAGMPARAVLASATIVPARMLKRDKDLGSIERGKIADLVLLREDPRTSVAAVGSVDTVLRGGEIVGSAGSATAEALVQRQLESYNAHDIEAFAGTYAEDVELHELGPVDKPANSTGIAQLRTDYGKLFKHVKPKAEVLARMAAGPFVVDHERATFGKQTIEAAAIYEVKDGRIRNVWFAEGAGPKAEDAAIVDRARAAAAAGRQGEFASLHSADHQLRYLGKEASSGRQGPPPLPAGRLAGPPAKRMQVGSYVIDHDASPEPAITIRLVRNGRIERTWVAAGR